MLGIGALSMPSAFARLGWAGSRVTQLARSGCAATAFLTGMVTCRRQLCGYCIIRGWHGFFWSLVLKARAASAKSQGMLHMLS